MRSHAARAVPEGASFQTRWSPSSHEFGPRLCRELRHFRLRIGDRRVEVRERPGVLMAAPAAARPAQLETPPVDDGRTDPSEELAERDALHRVGHDRPTCRAGNDIRLVAADVRLALAVRTLEVRLGLRL